MWTFLFIVTGVALFSLPVVPAIIELKRKSDVWPLGIDQTHSGVTRRFADRFRDYLADLEAGEGANLMQHIDRRGIAQEAASTGPRVSEPRVLIADETCVLPDAFQFGGEIYGRQDLVTGRENRIRAALAEGEIQFGRGTTLLRWAHAKRIKVAADCRIMGRLSAEESIECAQGGLFHRINARVIRFGEREAWPAESDRFEPVWSGERVFHQGDLSVRPNSVVEADLIVHGDLEIGGGAVVRGSAKSLGDMKLGEGARVHGALICMGRLTVGRDCAVLGPVVSETMVALGGNVRVGADGHPSTVTAPEIRIAAGVVAHGSVWAREQGVVLGEGAG